MPAPVPSVKSAFDQAAELPPDQRPAFLDQVCAGDEDLRKRLDALLRAYDQAGSFMESPAQTSAYQPAISEQPGTMIGPFKLLQLLGEGGMGEVWMAEQIQPVQRKVALKIMKPGMDRRPVLARFEAERQALALMDHPNIAKVLDGGVTAAGRPYFVMELVKGQSITKYCDEHRLSPRQRLELFVPVCQAIQHAHQKGIIHRDVKPSNILVAPYDGKPVVKVIDFGVAKATGQRLTEQTLFTEFGAVVGTLEYMSPEQAELNNQDIDTRSDVYSLGVLLYELLTGSTPLQRQRLKQAAFDEVLRLIREEDPPKPSTRLSESKESLPSISAQRQTEPARLTKLVRGELDWIVMKALDKDRNRRYETANGFARDIERYLTDEAVQACPLSAGYRLRKFVRRNKGAVLAASLLILALLAGIAGTSWGMFRAQNAQRSEAEQRHRAETNEQKALDAAQAEREAKETAIAREEESKAVLGFVESKVYAAARPEGQAGGLGKSVTLRQALDAALPFIEKSFEKQPLIEARLRLSMGKSYGYLGEFRIAAEQCAKAHEIYKRLLGPDDDATLESNNELSYNLDRLGRYDEALVLFQEAYAREKSKLGPHHVRTLGAMSNLANGYESVKRYSDALKLREEALVLMNAHLPPDDSFTLNVRHNLAKSYEQLGWREEALRLREDTLARRKAKLGPKHPDTLDGMASLAKSLALLNRHEQALPVFEKALALQREQIGSDHPSTLLTMTSLAGTYFALGRRDDAIRILEEALALGKAKHGADDLATLKSMSVLARHYALMGRYDQSIALLQEALAILKSKFGPDHADTFECMSNLSNVYHEFNDHDKALQLREEILALSKAKFGADNLDTVTSRANLANSYASMGRHEDALKLNEETLALLKAKLGLDHRSTLTAMFNLSSTYGRLGRYQEAAKLREEILARMKVAFGPDDPTTLFCMNGLACHYFSLGRYEDALQLHQQTLARMRAKLRPGHPSTLDSMSNLAQTLAVLGRNAEALALHKEAARHAAAHLPGKHPSALDATNELAWFLATTTDAKLRDPAEAVNVAAKVMELSPNSVSYRCTLGICRYRNREFQAAISDLEDASRHRKPDDYNRAYDGYFLAMANWQLGNKPVARDWFDKAVQWQALATREDAQLHRFQAEAAEMLGIEIKPKP